jgi:uncharacterized protein (DUF1501 family)
MNGRRLTLASPTRRTLLKAFAASGLLAAVERNRALAQSAPDYRALVCVFLQGGNDGENTLIRYDNAGYQNYAAIRTPASGVNIPQAQLLPIQPARSATPFGFHPACGPLKTFFDQKKLAVVANMGMLVQPTTRAGFLNQGAPRPANLFSHTDQEIQVQTADWTSFERTGWGGRIVDKLDPLNPGSVFPAMLTTAGMKTFTAGRTSIPLGVSTDSASGVTLHSSGDAAFQVDALTEAALREILAQGYGNTYDLAAQLLAEEGFQSSTVVAPILQNTGSIVRPLFSRVSGTVIGRQMMIIALMIEGRAQTQLKRQVFYAYHGGYDTHGSQIGYQQTQLTELSQALQAFDAAMTALGLANNVTSFTLSDFGRTFKPASSAGTDHGWGNYAFVLGGAVKGGDFYGTVPEQALAGPDDSGQDGRWIPSTSTEQYGATLARWLGIADADLPYVFPNIGAFASTNLGFMG